MTLALILFIATTAYAAVTEDISTSVGVGARSMGLGKAYVALADEPFGIFANPAGLKSIKHWQAATMQTSLLGGESNYLAFTTVQPFEWGNLGFGYVNNSIAGIPITSTVNGRPHQTSTMNYSDTVYALSYSNYFDHLFTDTIKNLGIGANLKYFNKSMATTEGSATGLSIDLGMQYQPETLPWLNLGLSTQNLVSSGLMWGTGEQELLPMVMKLGGTVQILGDNAIKEAIQSLLLSTEYEMRPNQPGYPNQMHLGMEWKPYSIVAIRGGIDQAWKGENGSVSYSNNFTLGVGLCYQGFAFDYAYHPYGTISENNAHYFAISYLGE